MSILKEFIEFTFTLKEMDEVKTKGFPVPTEILYEIDESKHLNLQIEIYKEKGLDMKNFQSEKVFEVEVYGIVLKFKIKK